MSAWAPHTEHDRLTRAVAAHGLAGCTLDLPDRPLDDHAFGTLLNAVRRQRITGLLWTAVREGALPATPEQAERTEWLHVQSLAGALALEHLLLDSVTALADEGIPTRVLKGPVLAHLDYPDPTWRTFGDIDLLVRGKDFDRAARVLAGRGHQRLQPEPRPGFDRRFSKGTSYRTEDGLELDLHRSFSMGPFGVRLALDDLWRSSEAFDIGGQEVHAMPAEERFVHACYHAVLGEASPRLVPLRDVAQLALTRSLDLERVHGLLRASRGEAVVARAVRHAWHALEVADVLALSAWAQSYRSDDREAADLAVYGKGSSYAEKSVASIRALPRWRDRAAFVHALVHPTRDYLGSRHDGRVSRLRWGFEQASRRRA
jgi:hypothetical protein